MNFRAENNEWHHGFQMDFANGCTISVQFSKGNYCDQGETTAEVAVFDKDNNFVTKKLVASAEHDVVGWLDKEELMDIINQIP